MVNFVTPFPESRMTARQQTHRKHGAYVLLEAPEIGKVGETEDMERS